MNQRQLDIFAMWSQGKTLQAVGEKFSVTRERVRQIVNLHPDYKECKVKLLAAKLSPWKCLFCGEQQLRVSSELFHSYCSRTCYVEHKKEKRIIYVSELKEKTCSLCKITKPIAEFYKLNALRFYSHCISCHTVYTRKWVALHPERVKEIQKKASLAWHNRFKQRDPEGYKKYQHDSFRRQYDKLMSTPEGREKLAARMRRYLSNPVNREKRNATKRRYYLSKKHAKEQAS